MKSSQQKIDSLSFKMCPSDEGQIVEVMYAVDEDGLWCRIHDRSDRSTTHQFARYPKGASESMLRFEPWNGVLPHHNKWQDVTIE